VCQRRQGVPDLASSVNRARPRGGGHRLLSAGRSGVVFLGLCLAAGTVAACSSSGGSPASISACGENISGRGPGGREIGLSSCAGLVGIQPSPTVRLALGQSLTLHVTQGAGMGAFSTDAPKVLSVSGSQTSEPTFVAASVGRADVYVDTKFCLFHNGTVGPCAVASVTVTP
jgi:hypothetical protein